MIITPDIQRRNQTVAAVVSVVIGLTSLALLWLSPWAGLGVLAAPVAYWLLRRKVKRRLRLASEAFPAAWQSALIQHVAFYRSLDERDRKRFQTLMQVFVDEVAITGIRTDVDDTTVALVAASAVIPVFGFDDWEYAGLGEVLIYPSRFGDELGVNEKSDGRILGMVGAGHLSGVMILSKPDLIAGFDIDNDKRNVGVHEFSHLVDKADGTIDGLPATISRDVVKPWIDWVGQELRSDATGLSANQKHIDDYAYTNEAEYFAVLSEYFFESPDVLAAKNPKLYEMLQKMYRQNTLKTLGRNRPRRRVGRNSPCPCGSGEKFKRCCLN